MHFKDLHEFIGYLETKNDLVRIERQVSSELEITEIADRMVKSGGPALLFENVLGSKFPLVINLFGTHQRVAWALGVDSTDEVVSRVKKILGIINNPPKSLMDKLGTLTNLAGIAKAQPKLVKKGVCQEITLIGSEVDLNKLPILKCWPEDAGKFITLPLVISKDPISGHRNVGIYRMQIFDSATTGMHWQTHKVGASHLRKGIDHKIERMEVAVALGGDPTTIWSGSMPLPPDLDEFAVSGIIREKSVEMVKCKTIDVDVPANAEFVLEGYVIPGELRKEGPFGDHTGYYSLPQNYPVYHVTAITHRRNPIYPTTMVGRPPSEDFFMGKASERIMLPALQMTLPEVVDMNMPAEGIFTNYVLVSIKKEFPGHARKVMYGLWGIGQMSLVKGIVIFDEHVNIQDHSEVAWRLGANVDPKRDIIIVEGAIDDLDHASSTPKFGAKIGIDATSKDQSEGRTEEWPNEIIMDPAIKNLVDQQWSEYNL